MDQIQTDHLKAYGVAFWTLKNGSNVDWLLNYRGGSFLIDNNFITERELKIRGILLTMFDKRNKLSSQVDDEARKFFKEKVYQTVIPRNVRLSEAPSHGLPCVVYDKNCLGSKSYLNLADEFLNQKNSNKENRL